MRPDVPLRQRPVDRVGERMQGDIGVGMSVQRMGVGQADAAEPDVVAGGKAVHVETLADARLARLARQPRFGRAEVRHRGHLEVLRIALEHEGGRARPFGDRHVVGEVADLHPGCTSVRFQNQRETKGLRGLHRPQATHAAGSRATWPTASICLTVSLSLTPGAAAPSALAASTARATSSGEGKGRAASWIRTMSGAVAASASSPARDACLPGRAAERGRPDGLPRRGGEARHRGVIEGAVIRVNHDRGRGKGPCGDERLERVGEKGLARAGQVLFRPVPAEPHAAAGRDDDEGDGRRGQRFGSGWASAFGAPRRPRQCPAA